MVKIKRAEPARELCVVPNDYKIESDRQPRCKTAKIGIRMERTIDKAQFLPVSDEKEIETAQ